MLSATRPDLPATPLGEPGPAAATDELTLQSVLTGTPGGPGGPASGDTETVPGLDPGSGMDAGSGLDPGSTLDAGSTFDEGSALDADATLDTGPAATTQPAAADTDATQPGPATADEPAEAPRDGEGDPLDQDATQRMTPVANGGNSKPRSSKPAAKEGKDRP
jgi:hypothetical protein